MGSEGEELEFSVILVRARCWLCLPLLFSNKRCELRQQGGLLVAW